MKKKKNSRFGVRGHPKRWKAEGSKAKKTALGSEVKMKLGIRIFLTCQIVFSTKRGTVSHKRNLWNREAVLSGVAWQEPKSKKVPIRGGWIRKG